MAALWLAAVALAFSQTPTRIYLDGGEDDADLRHSLEIELPPGTLVTSTSAADLRLVVRRGTDALIVELADSAGQNATRRFAMTETAEPALRRVVLLASRAQEALSAVFEEHDDPPQDVRRDALPRPDLPSTVLSIETGMSFVFWRTPAAPDPGPTISATLDFGPVAAGLRFLMGGVPSIARTARNIHGDALELSLLAELGLDLFSVGPVDLRLEAGAGVNFVRVDAAGTGVGGAPFAVQRFSGFEPVARLGPTLRIRVIEDWATVWTGGGVEGRLARIRVTLPAEYNAETLDSGGLVPFFQGGLGVVF